MSEIRELNEKKYQSLKKEQDELDNAVLCEQIADDSFGWWLDEALYWRKKGVDIREKKLGKKNIENTLYYDKIVEVLLEKGSYKEAIKWNKKSVAIKIKNKGEESIELLINKLMQAEIMLLLEKDLEGKKEADQAFDLLEKNILIIDKKCAYDVYLKLMHLYNNYNIGARFDGRETCVRNEICGEKAITIAGENFGESSLEMAEAIREKAITIYNDKQEALALFKRAISIYMSYKDNKKYAQQVFRDVRQKLEGQNLFNEKTAESISWFYKNSSEDFVMKAIDEFTEDDKIKMKEILNLM